MSVITKKSAWLALIVAHMCAAIDLAALPIWVGTLISGFGFNSAQAGGLASIFLVSAVICSFLISKNFHRLEGRWLAPLGFGVATIAFVLMTQQNSFGALAVLHAIGGAGVGMALSFNGGAMGKTSNPHRVNAMGSFGLSIAAILYLVLTPPLIVSYGPKMLFWVFAGIMLLATIVLIFFFPKTKDNEINKNTDIAKFSKTVWFVITGVVAITMINAMVLSFAERIGADAGFSAESVQTALIFMNLFAIIPPVLAALLQHHISPIKVGMFTLGIQACLAMIIVSTTDSSYWIYFSALLFYPASLIVAVIFLFGYLVKIEPTGRAVAASPVMIMGGSAIGPVISGIIIELTGSYLFVGVVVVVIAIVAGYCLWRAKVGSEMLTEG